MFTYRSTSSITRRRSVRLSPIAEYSRLQPPVGVWAVVYSIISYGTDYTFTLVRARGLRLTESEDSVFIPVFSGIPVVTGSNTRISRFPPVEEFRLRIFCTNDRIRIYAPSDSVLGLCFSFTLILFNTSRARFAWSFFMRRNGTRRASTAFTWLRSWTTNSARFLRLSVRMTPKLPSASRTNLNLPICRACWVKFTLMRTRYGNRLL